jgi:hypothetical protein
MLVPVQNHKKLDNCTHNGIYLGPVQGAIQQHHMWMSNTNKIIEMQDITVNEDVMGLSGVKRTSPDKYVQPGLLPLPNLVDD